MEKAQFHLPGLFEQYGFYKAFLPLTREHPEWFLEECAIASLYGAPAGCLWSGGRLGGGDTPADEALALCREYGLSARLTFSNSLLGEEHLSDAKCSRLCAAFEKAGGSGVIVHSDLLASHIRRTWPGLYLVSSTTKVILEPERLLRELAREEFRFAVPDFRLNHRWDVLNALSPAAKAKVELLVNEGCNTSCRDRYACYEAVSREALGEDAPEFICRSPHAGEGYRFSRAMRSPAFISREEIRGAYLPAGITNFKIEGRNLGSAVLLEMLLYYLVKPEHTVDVREALYLTGDLDLF